MHDHVAADHRQAAVGAGEAHVLGAVVVDDHVAGSETVRVGALEGLAMAVDEAERAADRREAGGGGGERDGRQGEGGSDCNAEKTSLQLH